MRAMVGPRPIIVLTLGPEGHLGVDDPIAARVIASVAAKPPLTRKALVKMTRGPTAGSRQLNP